MIELSALHDLMPLLPELTLACGAMLMLMFGAFIGERSNSAPQPAISKISNP